jgi:hypothetical protein
MVAANSTGGGNFHAANTIAAAIADTHPHVSIMIDACEQQPFPTVFSLSF